MKKTLSLLILTFLAGIASAQQYKFGVKARFTTAKMDVTQLGLSSNSENIHSIDFGVFAERAYGDLSFQPGLAFIRKGGGGNSPTIYNTSANTYSVLTSTLTFSYLEVPVNVVYNLKLKPGKIFFGGGPYLAYALSGKARVAYTLYNSSDAVIQKDNSSQSISFSSNQNDFKRFEVGLNALAGFRLNNGLELNLGLGAGLTNLTNDNDTKLTNHTLSAGAGYWFK